MGATGTSTPTGWFVGTGLVEISGTTVRVGSGTDTAGGNYSYGVVGDPDRALGSLASAGTQRNTEVRFTNQLAGSIASFNLSYTGEQWRVGGTAAVNNALTMQFSTDGMNFTNMGPLFDFNSLIDSGAAGMINGNLAANRVTGIGGTYTPENAIPIGSTWYLRWADIDNSSNDHGLALDDFTISFTLTAVPLHWDTNGNAPGRGGSGLWNGSTANWNPTSDGTGVPQLFDAANQAIFGGVAGTLTVDAAGVAANGGVQSETEGYRITGGKIALGGSATVATTHVTGATVIESVIEGAAGLVKAGAGILELLGVNTFSGPVAVTGGTLRISDDASLGNPGNDLLFSNATLAITNTVALAAGRNVSGVATFEIPAGQTLTISGSLDSSLTLASTGTLTLAGPTNSVGPLFFNAPATVNTTAPLTINTSVVSTATTGTVTINGPVSVPGGVPTLLIDDGSSAVDLLLNGALSGNGRLHKLGDGTLRLVGNNSGLTGGFRFGTAGLTPSAGGRLLIGDKDALGSGATLQMQFNDGVLEAETALTGPNAIPIGLSLGAGQLTGATFAGADMEFLGTIQLFTPGGTTLQHRVVVDNHLTFSGPLAATANSTGTSTGLTIAGSGTLRLANAMNAIAEPITVNGPAVTLEGSLNAISVTIEAGLLTGSGSVLELIVGDQNGNDATLAPANGVGTLTATSVAFGSDAKLQIEINSTLRTADKLVASAAVALGAGGAELIILELGTGVLPFGTTFTILENLDAAATTTGFFTGLPDLARFTVGVNAFEIDYDAGSDLNDVLLRVVPEPSCALLLAMGGAAMGCSRRRRR